MIHQDPILRAYAESGMRSAGEWQGLGRSVIEGIEPRTRVTSGGAELFLYTRDQTHRKVRSDRGRATKGENGSLPSHGPAAS